MRVIHKYPLFTGLRPVGNQLVIMPRDAKLLTIQVQRGQPVLWARVETENSPIGRVIHGIMTGQEISGDAGYATYIATCQFNGGDFVAHFFDGGEIRNHK